MSENDELLYQRYSQCIRTFTTKIKGIMRSDSQRFYPPDPTEQCCSLAIWLQQSRIHISKHHLLTQRLFNRMCEVIRCIEPTAVRQHFKAIISQAQLIIARHNQNCGDIVSTLIELLLLGLGESLDQTVRKRLSQYSSKSPRVPRQVESESLSRDQSITSALQQQQKQSLQDEQKPLQVFYRYAKSYSCLDLDVCDMRAKFFKLREQQTGINQLLQDSMNRNRGAQQAILMHNKNLNDAIKRRINHEASIIDALKTSLSPDKTQKGTTSIPGRGFYSAKSRPQSTTARAQSFFIQSLKGLALKPGKGFFSLPSSKEELQSKFQMEMSFYKVNQQMELKKISINGYFDPMKSTIQNPHQKRQQIVQRTAEVLRRNSRTVRGREGSFSRESSNLFDFRVMGTSNTIHR